MYAMIEVGGKQLKVEEGKSIFIEKVEGDAGETVTFDKVIVISGDDVKIGQPYVEGATVTGKIEKQGREKKVVTFKYKPKKDSRRKQGHRQPYTKVMIESING